MFAIIIIIVIVIIIICVAQILSYREERADKKHLSYKST